MSYEISAGVYSRETDQSFSVPAAANSTGGIVIHSNKGPTGELNLITSNKEFVDTYGEPTPNDPSMYAALSYLETGTRLYVGRAINDAVAGTLAVDDALTVLAFTVNAINEGVWGNSILITTSATVDEVFTLSVKFGGVVVESFQVTRNPLKKDGYGKSMYIEDVVSANSTYIAVVDNVANDWTLSTVEVLADEALTTGADDTVAPTDAMVNVEWDRFAVTEEVEVSLLINAGWATTVVHTKMIAVAEARRDCFAILDFAAADDTVGEMVTYVGTTLNPNTSYAAIYAGYLYIYDQYNDKYLHIPPSGYVAGVYATTAQTSEVWYAPAGSRRGTLNVLGVQSVWSEGDRDTLYAAKINPIQNFAGEGIQVYGQKTLQTAASALDRVNVRMLLISIQKSMDKALRPFVFEFNDTFTRENITSITNSYMEDIKVRRGVYDYLAVCDETNNTAAVIDQNKLLIDLYIKPTRVAEFVRLNVVITATGASFTSTV